MGDKGWRVGDLPGLVERPCEGWLCGVMVRWCNGLTGAAYREQRGRTRDFRTGIVRLLVETQKGVVVVVVVKGLASAILMEALEGLAAAGSGENIPLYVALTSVAQVPRSAPDSTVRGVLVTLTDAPAPHPAPAMPAAAAWAWVQS